MVSKRKTPARKVKRSTKPKIKLPPRKTEMDYWKLLTSLPENVGEAAQIFNILTTELERKFGIIRPKKCPPPNPDGTYPPAPRGKRWYREWFKSMGTPPRRVFTHPDIS